MEVDQKLVVTIPYYGTAEAEKKSQELQELYIKLGYAWVVYVDNEPRHLDKPYIVLDKDSNRFYFTTYLIGDENLMDFDTAISEAEKQLQDMELTPKFETEASEPKFQVGDKVYYRAYADICVVSDVSDLGEVQIKGWGEDYYNSRYFCHATQENYEMLCKLYPHIEFEAPPKPLSGDELVRAMLTKGIKNVLCLWGSGDKIIIDRLDYKGSLMSTNCNIVGGLTPIDWYTGEPLTESILND